jgi:hypothetical protein
MARKAQIPLVDHEVGGLRTVNAIMSLLQLWVATLRSVPQRICNVCEIQAVKSPQLDSSCPLTGECMNNRSCYTVPGFFSKESRGNNANNAKTFRSLASRALHVMYLNNTRKQMSSPVPAASE